MGKPKRQNQNSFILSYVQEEDVLKKRQIFLDFERTYLAKHEHIKEIGQMITSMKMVSNWIDENIDELYENRTK